MFPSLSAAAAPLLAPRPCWLDVTITRSPSLTGSSMWISHSSNGNAPNQSSLKNLRTASRPRRNAHPGDPRSGCVKDDLGREEAGLDHGVRPAPVEHLEEPTHDLPVLL